MGLPRAFVLTGSFLVVCRAPLYFQQLRERGLRILLVTPSSWRSAAQAAAQDPLHPSQALSDIAFVDGSVDKENSVRARFDLATAYEATGRTAEAMALYRGLVRDGQYVTGVQDVNYADRSAPIRRFNVAEESARRLAVLQMTATARPAAVFAQNTATGAAAAGEFGTPTAAVVGGTPVVEHRISDAEALRRDAAGTP